jgi:hydrogenase expression/formation protein
MGDHGVGCRGQGDFFVHKFLADLSQTTVNPLVSPASMDDTGAVQLDGINSQSQLVILSKMEGMHSRLSDYPFLAGFHVTRAALRDIFVKGGIPISLMVDVHLADDGDIGKLFDFEAGIATVAEITKVPITAGSTLRIGGDMVIGDRLTGGIAAIGLGKYNFFRQNIQLGDAVLMTEGAGGGTICTTAIYANHPEIIEETLNLKFAQACQLLFDHPELVAKIHTMADVTNGGLRNDLHEINREAHSGVKIDLSKVQQLVNSRVFGLLKSQNIDYLGVSLDALLIYCDPGIVSSILSVLNGAGIKCLQIGSVFKEEQVIFINENHEEIVVPRFRESPYTAIKKVIENTSDQAESVQETKIRNAFTFAQQKKMDLVSRISKSKNNSKIQ